MGIKPFFNWDRARFIRFIMPSDLPLSPISPDELYCDEAMPATEVMKIPVRYPYKKTYCGMELVYESDDEEPEAPPKCEPCYQLSSYTLADNAQELGIENRLPQILRTPPASAGPSRVEAATLEEIERDIWQPNDRPVKRLRFGGNTSPKVVISEIPPMPPLPSPSAEAKGDHQVVVYRSLS